MQIERREPSRNKANYHPASVSMRVPAPKAVRHTRSETGEEGRPLEALDWGY